MQLKPIAAILVLLLLVASLLVSGCTSNNTSTTNQTPSTSAATHDAFLEKYLAAYNNSWRSGGDQKITVWELAWINSTSARLQYTAQNKTTNATWAYDDTWLVFPTTQDATNYLNAMNKTAYSLSTTLYESHGAYYNATGHAPTVYKGYVWNEGNPFNISEYRGHSISQLDNVIKISIQKHL